jgi:NAD+ synthase (glutamine-hydrolysing)
MHAIPIALVQCDVTVGALHANGPKIARLAAEARQAGARVIAFPELVLSGYPPEDLVLKRHFVEDCIRELDRLAEDLPADALTVVGTPWSGGGPPLAGGGPVYNAAAIFMGGRLKGVYRKMLLPNYGVFDEKRVFAAGTEPGVVDFEGVRIGVHICEDSWFPEEAPCVSLRGSVDAVVNISASPYHRGKVALRQQVVTRAAAAVGCPVAYCNLVGGQDELVFDGTSLAVDGDGALLARGEAFAEEIVYVDLPIPGKSGADFSKVRKSRVAPLPEGPAELYGALKRGLRDYVDKNGFQRVVIGLSGGIDSAFVATLAVDALGRERVVGVTMPSRFTSAETLGDAGELARNLGIELHAVSIKALHDLYLQELAPLWPGREPDATEENLQARIRGNIVMALSNKFGWLVLTTGNKSEMATGYCTLYGDMAGGFAVIKDVPKTVVFELSRWRNAQGSAPIPQSTIDRPPTAELRANQKDTDSLPPYEVLDGILERYVERDLSVEQIVGDGFDAATVKRVIRMVDRNEYKRRQGAPGIKITPKAFGRDRRLPITNLYGERVN